MGVETHQGLRGSCVEVSLGHAVRPQLWRGQRAGRQCSKPPTPGWTFPAHTIVPPSTRERARGQSPGRACHHCAPEGLSTGLHEANRGGNTPPFSPLACASEQACHCQPCRTSRELRHLSRTQTGEDPCLTPPLLQEAGLGRQEWQLPFPSPGGSKGLSEDRHVDRQQRPEP